MRSLALSSYYAACSGAPDTPGAFPALRQTAHGFPHRGQRALPKQRLGRWRWGLWWRWRGAATHPVPDTLHSAVPQQPLLLRPCSQPCSAARDPSLLGHLAAPKRHWGHIISPSPHNGSDCKDLPVPWTTLYPAGLLCAQDESSAASISPTFPGAMTQEKYSYSSHSTQLRCQKYFRSQSIRESQDITECKQSFWSFSTYTFLVSIRGSI